MMQDCDTLLDGRLELSLLGVPARRGQGPRRADRPRRAHARHPLSDGGQTSIGDSKLTLRALLPLLERKTDRSWREKIEKDVAKWWQVIEQRAHEPAEPINPQLIFHELSKRLPDGAILTSDSGSRRQLVRARRASCARG